MGKVNIRFDSDNGVQQITLNSLDEISKMVETLQEVKDCLSSDSEETEKDIEMSDLFSYCLLNADGIVMAKILADRYSGTPLAGFHVFYEKDKIVAVAPASWIVIREENFDEED